MRSGYVRTVYRRRPAGIAMRLGSLLALLLAVGDPDRAYAQTGLVLPPNPVERLRPAEPPRLAPSLQPPPQAPQTGPGAAAEVRIGATSVSGNTALPELALRPAYVELQGATIPLARIEEARLALVRIYRDAGFPFIAVNAGLTRRADGAADLEFAITEGYVAEVRLDGDIGPAGTQVLRFLNRVLDQQPITSAALERALLLASDVPGVTVRGTLRPLQTAPGALQLVAQIERKWFGGFLNVDNRGFRLVGPWQGLLVAGLNSFTEFGERTELSLFGAEGSTQWFAQGSVEAFLGGSGLKLKIYGGTGETRPTGVLKQIGYFGSSQLGGAILSYPLLRSRPANVAVVGNLDLFDSTIETGTSGRSVNSRDQVRSFRFGFDGQALDGLVPYLPQATNVAQIRVHHGLDWFGGTRNGDPLSGRQGADRFDFFKITAEWQRTQPLFAPFDGAMVNIQGLGYGQWTDDVLPQSEKCYLGGTRIARGFYAGQVTGDQCWAASFELQLDTAFDLPVTLPIGNNRAAAQFYVFRDLSRAFENLPTDPSRRLSSWGGGVRLVLSDTVQFDLEGVHRVTQRPDGENADRLKDTGVFFRTLVRF